MSPELGIVFSQENTRETQQNFRILALHFGELGEYDEPLQLSIDQRPFDSEHFSLVGYEKEDLLIYPSSGKWFLSKESESGEVGLFDNAIKLESVKDAHGRIKVLIRSKEGETRICPLFEPLLSASKNLYYGEVERVTSADYEGTGYECEQEYLDILTFLEESTGLRIKDFFIKLSCYESSEKLGEVGMGALLLSIELR